jgi:hypothetical protein
MRHAMRGGIDDLQDQCGLSTWHCLQTRHGFSFWQLRVMIGANGCGLGDSIKTCR